MSLLTDQGQSLVDAHGGYVAAITALRQQGYTVADGLAVDGGVRLAKRGGGYQTAVHCTNDVIALVRGCPASHAVVAYK